MSIDPVYDALVSIRYFSVEKDNIAYMRSAANNLKKVINSTNRKSNLPKKLLDSIVVQYQQINKSISILQQFKNSRN